MGIYGRNGVYRGRSSVQKGAECVEQVVSEIKMALRHLEKSLVRSKLPLFRLTFWLSVVVHGRKLSEHPVSSVNLRFLLIFRKSIKILTVMPMSYYIKRDEFYKDQL